MVHRLLAPGASSWRIAGALTVKTHVADIMRKPEVPARAKVAARARELGLIHHHT